MERMGVISVAVPMSHPTTADFLDNSVVAERLANHRRQPLSLPAILCPTHRQVNARRASCVPGCQAPARPDPRPQAGP